MPDVLEKIVVIPAGAGAEVFQRVRGLLDMNCGAGETDRLVELATLAFDHATAS